MCENDRDVPWNQATNRQRYIYYVLSKLNYSFMPLKLLNKPVRSSETRAIYGLSCKHLDLRIGGVEVAADLSLELAPGEFWGLLGANGIGKTTLLKCLAGLLAPASGQVFLESRDINELPRKLVARHLGMLQQHTVYLFDSSVLQTVLTGRHPHLAYWERRGYE